MSPPSISICRLTVRAARLRRRIGQRLSRANQPVPVLQFARSVAGGRHDDSLVHQFDAEVERLTGRREPIETVVWLRPGEEPGFDRGKPSPVALAGDQAACIAKAMDHLRDRGRTHIQAEICDEVPYAFERNAICRQL